MMTCWKCDGEHSPMDCPRWRGFAAPPDREPPGRRKAVAKSYPVSAPVISVAVERVSPKPGHRVLLAPRGQCSYCDARREADAARLKRHRGKQR